jgi:hypothetical protein
MKTNKEKKYEALMIVTLISWLGIIFILAFINA